jgi:hypothetical protein
MRQRLYQQERLRGTEIGRRRRFFALGTFEKHPPKWLQRQKEPLPGLELAAKLQVKDLRQPLELFSSSGRTTFIRTFAAGALLQVAVTLWATEWVYDNLTKRVPPWSTGLIFLMCAAVPVTGTAAILFQRYAAVASNCWPAQLTCAFVRERDSYYTSRQVRSLTLLPNDILRYARSRFPDLLLACCCEADCR